MRFLFLFLAFFLISCSSDVKMEPDILAYHMYSQAQIDLDSKNKESVALLAKSFGMKESEVIEIQKHILSKKTGSTLRWSFMAGIENKIAHLAKEKSAKSREDFVVNVLEPYLNLLVRNELQTVGLESQNLQDVICRLFAKYFSEGGQNSLTVFINDVRLYFDGGISTIENLHALNATLLNYGYFIDCEYTSYLNILKVKDEILPETPYGNSAVRILNLRRFIPGLLPPKSGYYTIESNIVIVLDDMVARSAEETMAEMVREDFVKYADRRFNAFWHSIGLNLDVFRASQIYMELVKRDFAGKDFEYVKNAGVVGVAIHEAKHLVDHIEQPELTLNLDREFNAHVVQAIYGIAVYSELFAAIDRMQNYAMHNRVHVLNDVTRKLWEMAIRSAEDSSYTVEVLRRDLKELYNNYRSIREHAQFGSLDKFEKIADAVRFSLK